MEEEQKVESGEQEEKELTAKEKIELERQEEAKLRQKFPMAGRPGLPGKPAGGKILSLLCGLSSYHHTCLRRDTNFVVLTPNLICRAWGSVKLLAETHGQEHQIFRQWGLSGKSL